MNISKRLLSIALVTILLLVVLTDTWPRPAISSATKGPVETPNLPLEAQIPISALLGENLAVYHTRPDEPELSMVNPAHDFSARFTNTGVSIQMGEYTWGLAMQSYGYGDDLQPALAVAPTRSRNRVEYDRGLIREWYVNGPMGLEQGFSLVSRPGQEANGPLTIRMGTSGNLRASSEREGKRLTLTSQDGISRLEYTDIEAYDKHQHALPAWLEVTEAALIVKVDDAGAEYPIVIDPFIQSAKFTASDVSLEARFGDSVAVEGDVIVIGATGASSGGLQCTGAVYVFQKPISGWADMTETARLTASDPSIRDFPFCNEFGFSVAINNNVIVVGDRQYTFAGTGGSGSLPGAGKVYVFVKPTGGWTDMTETARLSASDKETLANLGSGVAISNDTILAGASSASPEGITYAGAAYIFVKPPTGWGGDLTENAKLTASDKMPGDGFGFWGLDIDGDVAAIGAYASDPGGITDAGAAYAFVKPVGGWQGHLTENAKLTASDNSVNGNLGWALAMSGDTIVVGRVWGVYVFVRPIGGWSGKLNQQAILKPSTGTCAGYTVDIHNDTIIAAHSFYSDIYVFNKPKSGWVDMTETDIAKNPQTGADAETFSVAVDLGDGFIAAGNPFATTAGQAKAGEAYVFAYIPFISGNAGVAGATLSYTDGTPKTATADANGNYSFTVSYNWAGAVTPSKENYTFIPASRTYPNVLASMIAEDYTAAPIPYTAVIYSAGVSDGWVLELSETSNTGGSLNASGKTFQLGDDALNRQYKTILSFNTSGLPTGAVIQAAVLRLKQYGKPVGSNPFTVLGSLLVDLKKGTFGKMNLETADFQSVATAKKVGIFGKIATNSWYSVRLGAAGISKINRTGLTQFRLYFSKDDNNDFGADYLKFFSGNNPAYKPELTITYMLP